MSDEVKQKISALMDGDTDGDHSFVIDQLMSSDAHRETWRRYHLISDAMQQNLPDCMDLGLAGRITEEISGQPAILSPANIYSRRFLKPLAGLAIAASVAGIAVIGIQNQASDQPGAVPVQVAGGDSSALNVSTNQDINQNINQYTFPVTSQVVSPDSTVEESPGFETGSRLSSYLVNYNEYRATQTGVQSINPYVRIIANDDGQ